MVWSQNIFFLQLLVVLPVLFLIFFSFSYTFNGYIPFKEVYTTSELLQSNIIIKVIGMLFTAIIWGFFEAFNYVFISQKINTCYPSKNKWINWGAIVCGVMCLLIHGSIGITSHDIIEMLTVFFIIYGMLMVKEFTGNAWGCIFIFVFLWNAF